jgi:hypothetical protein
VLVEDIRIYEVACIRSEKDRGFVQENDRERVAPRAESERDSNGFGGAVCCERVLTDDDYKVRSHRLLRHALVEREKAITAVDYLGQNDKAAQRHSAVEIPCVNPVLLAAVGAHEKLRSGRGKIEKALIAEVLHSFVDEV